MDIPPLTTNLKLTMKKTLYMSIKLKTNLSEFY
jgi:hypothetical protein